MARGAPICCVVLPLFVFLLCWETVSAHVEGGDAQRVFPTWTVLVLMPRIVALMARSRLHLIKHEGLIASYDQMGR